MESYRNENGDPRQRTVVKLGQFDGKYVPYLKAAFAKDSDPAEARDEGRLEELILPIERVFEKRVTIIAAPSQAVHYQSVQVCRMRSHVRITILLPSIDEEGARVAILDIGDIHPLAFGNGGVGRHVALSAPVCGRNRIARILRTQEDIALTGTPGKAPYKVTRPGNVCGLGYINRSTDGESPVEFAQSLPEVGAEVEVSVRTSQVEDGCGTEVRQFCSVLQCARKLTSSITERREIV